MSSRVYTALKIFLRQVTGNYFRNIHVAGIENMPMEGPTILCCNHSNQFMDGMLIISQCPRPLSFCFAASSFNKPIVGYLAKKINVIPVYRAEDSKIQGKGNLIMTSDTDIQGFNTKFISDVKNNKNFNLGIHALLIQKKYKLIVEKVIDEEHIKVRSDPKVYENLKKGDKCNFYFIPKIDNSLMFRETCHKLKEGKAICIFPEGTSHDRTHLLQLKPGVAYIALEAMANHGVKNIKLLSCGFSYFSRDQFRSDLVLEFGIPFEIPESFGETFKVNKRQAIDLVLKIVETQMKSVILTAPTYKEYMFIKMLCNLYIPSNVELPAEKSTDLARRISYIYNQVRDSHKAKQIKIKVMKYMDPLEKLGIEDSDLKEKEHLEYNLLLLKFIFSFFLLIVNFLFTSLMLPLALFVEKIGEKERQKALEKNPNKLEGKDVVSSVKVVTFVKYLPFVGIFWLFLCYYVINKWLDMKFTLLSIFFIGCITFMIYGYISINIIDSLRYLYESMKTTFYYFVVPKGIDNLKVMREKLVDEVNDFFDESIKDTQYENNRIINSPKKLLNL
jgi:glycerol-3-phosphate O-acyltransferase/dihydroxyacetone phosphate acyltransferase